MAKIKVIDSHNACFSWIAEKCVNNPKSAIFVFNKMSKHLMLLSLAKYGAKNIPVDIPEKFFASLIRKQFVPTHHICSVIKKQTGLFKDRNGYERDLIIWRCVRIYLSEKASMEDFYNQQPMWEYITKEEYNKFKETISKFNFVTGFDIIEECINKDIKATVKNLFILGYEDGYKLLYKAINKCLIPENIYFIGDPYRYSAYYTNCDDIEFNNIVDLNLSLQIPTGMYNVFTKIKNKLGIPYDIKASNAFGKVVYYKDINKALSYFQSKQFDLACIVYETPMYAEHIESILFSKNIPFRGVTEKYKFPVNLYMVRNVMDNVCNNKGIVTYKEIKTLIESIKGEITDKFGGKKELLKLYSLPTVSGATLHKTNFFKYLVKVWLNSGFHLCLHDNLRLQWVMWKGKLTKSWYSPNIYCGIVTSMKYLNPDYSICISHLPEENDKLIYTMLLLTKKEVIVV